MKKLLLTISTICVTAIAANAQITITTADIATAGQTVYGASDTLPTINVGTASATSQTWNFAALAQHTLDTLSFMSYASMPNPTFSTANLVAQQGVNYIYLNNSATSLEILGSSGTNNIGGSPVTITQTITPSEQLATFPLTYTSTFNNTYRIYAKFFYGQDPGIGITIDSIRQHSTTQKSVVVDAWGTLTTPLGTYDVIRSKETKIVRDTFDAFYVFIIPPGTWHDNTSTSADSTTKYTWWANGLGFSLATATMDSLGAVTKVDWLKSIPVGIAGADAAAYQIVYPNPAANEINFIADATKQKAIQITDIAGRLIETVLVENNQTTINTSAYANGIYMYSISAKDNTILNRGKFTISK